MSHLSRAAKNIGCDCVLRLAISSGPIAFCDWETLHVAFAAGKLCTCALRLKNCLRLKWPFTEWETGPEQKIPEKWERNGKWPHAWNGRKMAAKMEKMAKIRPKSRFRVHFTVLMALFWPFRAWGHFPFSFPFFRDFCSGPVSHSVHGHFNRNASDYDCDYLVHSGPALLLALAWPLLRLAGPESEIDISITVFVVASRCGLCLGGSSSTYSWSFFAYS